MAAPAPPASSQPDRTEVSARRRFAGPPNRNKGPWYGLTVLRLGFERGVKSQFPRLRGARVKKGYEYRVTVPVPYYEPRNIRIRFNGVSDVPSVFADGPPDSPHRYSDDSLCMWYPSDPVECRWVFEGWPAHPDWLGHGSPVQGSLVARYRRVGWRGGIARAADKGECTNLTETQQFSLPWPVVGAVLIASVSFIRVRSD